jgi:cobalt/nickel transport system permease protein
MAFVIPFAGYALYKLVKDRTESRTARYAALAVASYVALNAAALCAAVEFGVQPLVAKDANGAPLFCPYPLAVSIPAMMIPHLLVAGVVEAAFTVSIVAFVAKASPDAIYARSPSAPRLKPLYAILAFLVVASPLGLLAAGTAWGEWGADEIKDVVSGGSPLGFVPSGMRNGFSFEAPIPDYALGGASGTLGYIVSAALGSAILVIAFKLLGLLKKGAASKA